MRIKLFEDFEAGKKTFVLDSFDEAESKLSDKDGVVLQGIGGDMTDVEEAIKGMDYAEAYILVTDKSSHVASSWKSDVFLVGAKNRMYAGPSHKPAKMVPADKRPKTTIKEYFNKNESLTEGTLISKRNMDLDDFRKQGSFFEDKKKPVNENQEEGPELKLDADDILHILKGEEVKLIVKSKIYRVRSIASDKALMDVLAITSAGLEDK